MTTDLKTKNQGLMKQVFTNTEVEVCLACKTIHQLVLIKPGEDYNDFGIRFCPYCGYSTESLPDWVTAKIQNIGNNFFVLITISGGLIDQVKFYEEPLVAISALSDFIKTINPENEDAGVYGKEGLIANAKDFLDENDEFISPHQKHRT
ncbi:MAG: hypothetical protein ABIJ59_12210 [Pseudomonadota bacterium]